jgi:hypothetical protein
MTGTSDLPLRQSSASLTEVNGDASAIVPEAFGTSRGWSSYGWPRLTHQPRVRAFSPARGLPNCAGHFRAKPMDDRTSEFEGTIRAQDSLIGEAQGKSPAIFGGRVC